MSGGGEPGRSAPSASRPRLLLFTTSADHPQRDTACATLAWVARSRGLLFECYFDSAHTGIHFGGGHPGWYSPDALRGSTVTGGRHLEALHLLLEQFACEAACLGPSLFEAPLRAAGIPIRSSSGDIVTFYREVIGTVAGGWPDTALLVGDGGRPQGIPLAPYAFPEIAERSVLGLAAGDWDAVDQLPATMAVEGLWLTPDQQAALSARRPGSTFVPAPSGRSVAEQTAWMARRWRRHDDGFLFGDPELVGRWAPTALRERWAPVYGIPQVEVMDGLAEELSSLPLVYGRQHHDRDFVRLSEMGVGFQVIDPGSPPLPVLSQADPAWPTRPSCTEEPSDAELAGWADEGRVLVSLLFWTGMIRELQNLYPLADILALTGLRSGVVLTTESYRFMAGTALPLLNVPREQGGLHPRVEPLLTDTGSGVLVAGHAPAEKFAATLQDSVTELGKRLGDPAQVPVGWWAHLDTPLLPGRAPLVSRFPDRPRVRVRYRPRDRELEEPPAGPTSPAGDRGLRARVRESRLGAYFAPLRPYERYRPGSPSPAVIEAVAAAGFDYAISKAAPGPHPRATVMPGGGLTVLNHTAGRWDGWSPFHTINALSDLENAERALLRQRRAGWLLGALDTCLWAFTGPVWERGGDLYELSRWAAGGGTAGELVNVTPRTVARYARLLAERGLVDPLI